MQTLAREGIYDGDGRDQRLDKALSLLEARNNRARNGLISLAAVVGLVCSGTLLTTILTGSEGVTTRTVSHGAANSQQAVRPSANPGFELSGSPPPASENASPQPAVKDAVLIGTEH